MPYHVIAHLRAASPTSVSICALDLTQDEVQQLYVLPWLSDQPLIFGGRAVPAQNVDNMAVTYTDKRSSQLLPAVRIGAYESNNTNESTDLLFARSGVDVTHEFQDLVKPRSPAPDSATKVFVVHGRNERIRKDMYGFLGALKLHPLEWSQVRKATGNATPFISEILDKAFKLAQAVVVLMTPDDVGMLMPHFRQRTDATYETQLTGQPRLNVIFEAGMSWQRNPRRTIIVQIGDVRPLSDISGVYTVRLDNSPAQRQDLAQRLIDAGCPADTSGTDWFNIGNFTISGDELAQ